MELARTSSVGLGLYERATIPSGRADLGQKRTHMLAQALRFC